MRRGLPAFNGEVHPVAALVGVREHEGRAVPGRPPDDPLPHPEGRFLVDLHSLGRRPPDGEPVAVPLKVDGGPGPHGPAGEIEEAVEVAVELVGHARPPDHLAPRRVRLQLRSPRAVLLDPPEVLRLLPEANVLAEGLLESLLFPEEEEGEEDGEAAEEGQADGETRQAGGKGGAVDEEGAKAPFQSRRAPPPKPRTAPFEKGHGAPDEKEVPPAAEARTRRRRGRRSTRARGGNRLPR